MKLSTTFNGYQGTQSHTTATVRRFTGAQLTSTPNINRTHKVIRIAQERDRAEAEMNKVLGLARLEDVRAGRKEARREKLLNLRRK